VLAQVQQLHEQMSLIASRQATQNGSVVGSGHIAKLFAQSNALMAALLEQQQQQQPMHRTQSDRDVNVTVSGAGAAAAAASVSATPSAAAAAADASAADGKCEPPPLASISVTPYDAEIEESGSNNMTTKKASGAPSLHPHRQQRQQHQQDKKQAAAIATATNNNHSNSNSNSNSNSSSSNSGDDGKAKEWTQLFVECLQSDPELINERLTDLFSDFSQAAAQYGKTIVSEMALSDEHRTIPCKKLGGVAGGTKHLVGNIVFKRAVDPKLDGTQQFLYGGAVPSTEAANKAAGHELRGAVSMFNLGSKRLLVPMQVLIDYRGFRLIAMPLLPLKELVYGSDDGGVSVLNSDTKCNAAMTAAAKQLHLSEHKVRSCLFVCGIFLLSLLLLLIVSSIRFVKRSHTHTHTHTHTRTTQQCGNQVLCAAGDVEAHSGDIAGRYYVLDLARRTFVCMCCVFRECMQSLCVMRASLTCLSSKSTLLSPSHLHHHHHHHHHSHATRVLRVAFAGAIAEHFLSIATPRTADILKAERISCAVFRQLEQLEPRRRSTRAFAARKASYLGAAQYGGAKLRRRARRFGYAQQRQE
jgi:hypothetical protein